MARKRTKKQKSSCCVSCTDPSSQRNSAYLPADYTVDLQAVQRKLESAVDAKLQSILETDANSRKSVMEHYRQLDAILEPNENGDVEVDPNDVTELLENIIEILEERPEALPKAHFPIIKCLELETESNTEDENKYLIQIRIQILKILIMICNSYKDNEGCQQILNTFHQYATRNIWATSFAVIIKRVGILVLEKPDSEELNYIILFIRVLLEKYPIDQRNKFLSVLNDNGLYYSSSNFNKKFPNEKDIKDIWKNYRFLSTYSKDHNLLKLNGRNSVPCESTNSLNSTKSDKIKVSFMDIPKVVKKEEKPIVVVENQSQTKNTPNNPEENESGPIKSSMLIIDESDAKAPSRKLVEEESIVDTQIKVCLVISAFFLFIIYRLSFGEPEEESYAKSACMQFMGQFGADSREFCWTIESSYDTLLAYLGFR